MLARTAVIPLPPPFHSGALQVQEAELKYDKVTSRHRGGRATLLLHN